MDRASLEQLPWGWGVQPETEVKVPGVNELGGGW
jgi:hypothetical protein